MPTPPPAQPTVIVIDDDQAMREFYQRPHTIGRLSGENAGLGG